MMAAVDPAMGFMELAPGAAKQEVVKLDLLYSELQDEISKGDLRAMDM